MQLNRGEIILNLDKTNKSKKDRLEMLKFLDLLKDVTSDKEHRKTIRKIERFLNEKKYGLIWERHLEQVDIDLEWQEKTGRTSQLFLINCV